MTESEQERQREAYRRIMEKLKKKPKTREEKLAERAERLKKKRDNAKASSRVSKARVQRNTLEQKKQDPRS